MGQSKSKSYVFRSRERIRAGKILPRLIDHFNGETELTSSQINVGLTLLKKVLPDTVHAVLETNMNDETDRKMATSDLYRQVLEEHSDSEEG